LFVGGDFVRHSTPWCSSVGGVLMRWPDTLFGVDTAR
jgi:hypothetical protein